MNGNDHQNIYCRTQNCFILDIKRIKIKSAADERGTLSFLENTAEETGVPFRYERVFWIYNVPEGAERGKHAHRTCAEFFVALHGSCDIELNDGRKSAVVHLDKPDEGIVIPAMIWCRLYNFSQDFVGLCLASQHYTPEGYINDFSVFQREVSHSNI